MDQSFSNVGSYQSHSENVKTTTTKQHEKAHKPQQAAIPEKTHIMSLSMLNKEVSANIWKSTLVVHKLHLLEHTLSCAHKAFS